MPTEAWKGFIHSWHTLGVVLKWMCMTVVGIPLAFATCIVVALAVLLFGLLCLCAAVGVIAILVYFVKGLCWLIKQVPIWIEDLKFRHAERKLLRLPIAHAHGVQLEQWNGKARGIQRPTEMTPSGYMPSLGDLQPPPRARLSLTSPKPAAGPSSDLPGMTECEVCMEEKMPTDFPSRAPTVGCTHEAKICCISCLSQSIVSAFEGNMWDDIRCPICNLQLQHNDIAEFAPPNIFEK